MKKLVCYITPKIPNSSFTVDLCGALYSAGVDMIELGVPFTDPVADGAVIEGATRAALANGFKLTDLYQISEQLKGNDLLWMGYMNPFYHQGMEFIASKCKDLGVSGLIIPDLPHEEAERYRDIFIRSDVDLIEFIAPTTPSDRIGKIAKNANKFIYLVAYTGITGSGKDEDLMPTIRSIKSATSTPVFVGFGVNRSTAKTRANGADGVIVGSALIKILMDESKSAQNRLDLIVDEARIIKEIINS